MTADFAREPDALDPTFLQPREPTRAPGHGLSQPRKWSSETIDEGLREGRLQRLQAQPAPLLSTLIGSSARRVRLHSDLWSLQLMTPRPRWRLNARDHGEMAAQFGRVTFRFGEWSYLYADPQQGEVAALDEGGGLAAEWNLQCWCDGGVAGSAGSTHRAQRPPEAGGRLAEFEIHRTQFDRELYLSAWQDCDSYRETTKLEKAARTDRESLLEQLPDRVARKLHPSVVQQVFETVGDDEAPVVCELAGRGYRAAIAVENLRARGMGRISAADARGLDGLMNWNAIGAAFGVSLPRRGRMVRAVEVVDSRGDFALRLRRPYDASPTRVLNWRATLDRHRRG